MNHNTLQGFFTELSNTKEAKYVGDILKQMYNLIQFQKSVLQNYGSLSNTVKEQAALLGNRILYYYGNGSLADKHVEIVQYIMNGNIDDLNSLENTIHVYNRNRGIKEVDELLDTILHNTNQTHYNKRVVLPTGNVKEVILQIEPNRVAQNNETNPENPLEVKHRGISMIPTTHPRDFTMLEQINSVENVLNNAMTPGKVPEKINRTKVDIKVLSR